MTIKEFAVKYGLKYQTVYAASYRVRFVQPSPWDRREYPEGELFKAVDTMLTERIEKYRHETDKAIEQRDILRGN